MITNIIINGLKEKCFLLTNKKNLPLTISTIDMPLSDKVNFSSIIKTNEDKNLFIKITESKYGQGDDNLKFFFREIIAERLFLNVKTIREYKCIKLLQKNGIKTPNVYGAGYFLSNTRNYSGIIIYERLHNQITAQEFLLSDESEENKTKLLENIAVDYRRISKKGIHFYDFHLSNVLVDIKSLDIYWIDPRLRKLSYF